jgi:N-acetylglucosamine kinase-like BadF-type ATPase
MTTAAPANLFFAGIDGGGSGTRVLIASQDGKICGLGQSGPSNPNYAGANAAITSLQTAFSAAWKDAGLSAQPLDGAFLGIAGIGSYQREHSIDDFTDWIPKQPQAAFRVDHDIRIALSGGLSGRDGVALVAGTGSCAYGRDAQGRTFQSGGWGSLLDDAGSGYWLGLQVLKAVIRSHDGRGPATLLSEAVQHALGSTHPSDILEWLRMRENSRVQVAELATLVFKSAGSNDPEAMRILQAGADELAQMAIAVSERLFKNASVPVVLMGGLSRESLYRQVIASALSRRSSQVTLVDAEHSAVVGALCLAAEASGSVASSELLNAADRKAPV